MWPFKKKRALPYADDLRSSERKWLESNRQVLPELGKLAGVAPGTNPLQMADAVIAYWHRLPEAERADANDVVSVAGVALGDALAAKHGLEWKIVTDAFGTDVALWWSGGGDRNLILAPTHSIAKRFADSPSGCVVQLFEAISASVESAKAH